MSSKPAKTFKVLGILLWYPGKEWLSGVHELCNLMDAEAVLSSNDRTAIRAFATALAAEDVLEAQENYTEVFDRVRAMSLHLFEHVHGDSRDRGQAMVDLSERYKEQGLELAKSELPDYLPVFLEYLSTLPLAEARDMLEEPVHILQALGKRLGECGSSYHVVFDALVRLAGHKPEKVVRKTSFIQPTLEQLDKDWEETPIDFMGAAPPESAGCGSGGCGSGGCGGGQKSEPCTTGAL